MIEHIAEHFMSLYIGAMGFALIAYESRLRATQSRIRESSSATLPE